MHWSEQMVSKDAAFFTVSDGETAKATIFGGVEERPRLVHGRRRRGVGGGGGAMNGWSGVEEVRLDSGNR